MPIPMIWAAGAAVLAVAGAAYAYFKDDKDESNDSKNKRFKYGSTILIGPQGAGKTHLANWLNDNKLLNDYNPTTNKIKVGEFLDIRGGEIQARDWENLIINQKNIFYLFDMEKFLAKKEYAKSKYDEIVFKHITFFTEYLEKKGSMLNKKLIIIGTHLDKINNSKIQNIIDTLQEEINSRDTEIIYGSLLNEKEAKKLEEEIIKILEKGSI